MNRREYIKQSALALGLSISAGTFSQLLSSCSEDTLEWIPTFLNLEEANLLTSIVNTLLPKTKTPGAVELGVPQLIDKLIPLTYDEEGQLKFTAGLSDFQGKCKEKYDNLFENLNEQERRSFLIEEDKSSAPFPISMWGIMLDPNPAPVTFYRNLKSLILMGYYSSEKIGEEFLEYAPVPGPYQGCIAYEGQNAWSE